METITAPGTFEDERGIEAITWTIQSSDRPGWQRRFEARTRVHGVEVWGGDFDGLEPVDLDAARAAALPLSLADELSDCVLTGDLPCMAEVDGKRQRIDVRFRLDLRPDPTRQPHDPKNLQLSAKLAGADYAITDDWFEDATLRLDRAMRPNRLICCATCLYSDYSPYGHGLMGMLCHRGSKDQYLAVRSKFDYFRVPVTEDVPETYLCEEYEDRVPGTGYRG